MARKVRVATARVTSLMVEVKAHGTKDTEAKSARKASWTEVIESAKTIMEASAMAKAQEIEATKAMVARLIAKLLEIKVMASTKAMAKALETREISMEKGLARASERKARTRAIALLGKVMLLAKDSKEKAIAMVVKTQKYGKVMEAAKETIGKAKQMDMPRVINRTALEENAM